MRMVDRLFDIPPDVEVRADGIWAWLKTYGMDGSSQVRTGERCLLTPHCAQMKPTTAPMQNETRGTPITRAPAMTRPQRLKP